MFALEVHGLRKVFDRPAVDGLDLTVRTGEFYALLGPNGAGKTTSLRMIAGLLRPDAGSIKVTGIDALADPVGAKQVMAWISDEPLATYAEAFASISCAWTAALAAAHSPLAAFPAVGTLVVLWAAFAISPRPAS
jgi:ABC-type Na+ transport system ATPase subunit NatA